MSDALITVYSRRTGLKHRVPAHYLDHPVLSKQWRKTPKTREVEARSTAPGTGAAVASTNTDTPPAGDEKE